MPRKRPPKPPPEPGGPAEEPTPPASETPVSEPPEAAPDADKPQPAVTPTEVSVAGPARQQSVGLTVTNQGGGRLEADVTADQPWIQVDPTHISENHVKIEVSIDLNQLQPEQEQTGKIRINGVDCELSIPVRAVRYGIERASKLYLEGQAAEAREVCRQLLQSDATNPDANLVLAGLYLDEGNAASAVRSLQASTQPASALSDDVLKRLVESMRAHGDALGELDCGVPVMERLLPSCSPTMRQTVDEALHQSYAQALKHRLASASPDLDRLQALLDAARARYPNDPQWAELHARFPQKPAAAASEQRPTSLWATIGVGLLAVPLTLVVLFLFLPAYQLRQGHEALAHQDWEGAINQAEKVLYWDNTSAEAKQIRAQASAQLAEAYFRSDNQELAQLYLRDALRDAPNDAGLVKREIEFYALWGQAAERRARYDVAMHDYQVVQALQPSNAKVTDTLHRLQAAGELYSMLSTLHAASGKTMVPLDVTPNPPTGLGARLCFRSFGIQWFERRIQVLTADVDGDGRDEIVVAGSDNEQHGGLFIYRAPPVGGKEKLPKLSILKYFKFTPVGYLDRIEVLAQGGKNVLVARFLPRAAAPGGRMMFVWWQDHQGSVWEPSNVNAATDDAAALWAKRPKG